MTSIHSDSRSRVSKRSGLRPYTRAPTSPIGSSQVFPSVITQAPIVSSTYLPVEAQTDDLSINSVESQTEHTLPVVPDIDYLRLGTWMHDRFSHHFSIQDAYFINHILKLQSSLEVRGFLDTKPQDILEELGVDVYNKWLNTLINCVTFWSILLDMTSSLPLPTFMDMRSQLHEMVKQSFTEILQPPPPYQRISSLAVQHGVTYQAMPTAPSMVDSHGEVYASSAPFSGGLEEYKDAHDDDRSRRSHRTIHSSKWENASVRTDGSRVSAKSTGSKYRPPRNLGSRNGGDSSPYKLTPLESDRHYRSLPMKARSKFEKISWDGLHSTFKPFSRAVEGHLLQVGAGYLASKEFVDVYKTLKEEYFKTQQFWNTYKVSYPQALYDVRYLYGILLTATQKMQHKIILKYEASQDGILAWNEFKKDFAHDGSEDLKIEQLETKVHEPYSSREPGSMAAFIDKFQAYVAELETMIPADYTDARKKRLLLTNIRDAEGVAHLIQKCRDDNGMSYDATAAYLRKNAILVDHANRIKPTRKVMTVGNTAETSDHTTMDIDKVSSLFHSMAVEGGLETTYKMFNMRSFRQSMRIPDVIWKELDEPLRRKIQEIRETLKRKVPSPLPNQYPSMASKDTTANLCNVFTEISAGDLDEDTDDEALPSSFAGIVTTKCAFAGMVSTTPSARPQGELDDVIRSNDQNLFRDRGASPHVTTSDVAQNGGDTMIFKKNAILAKVMDKYDEADLIPETMLDRSTAEVNNGITVNVLVLPKDKEITGPGPPFRSEKEQGNRSKNHMETNKSS